MSLPTIHRLKPTLSGYMAVWLVMQLPKPVLLDKLSSKFLGNELEDYWDDSANTLY